MKIINFTNFSNYFGKNLSIYTYKFFKYQLLHNNKDDILNLIDIKKWYYFISESKIQLKCSCGLEDILCCLNSRFESENDVRFCGCSILDQYCCSGLPSYCTSIFIKDKINKNQFFNCVLIKDKSINVIQQGRFFSNKIPMSKKIIKELRLAKQVCVMIFLENFYNDVLKINKLYDEMTIINRKRKKTDDDEIKWLRSKFFISRRHVEMLKKKKILYSMLESFTYDSQREIFFEFKGVILELAENNVFNIYRLSMRENLSKYKKYINLSEGCIDTYEFNIKQKRQNIIKEIEKNKKDEKEDLNLLYLINLKKKNLAGIVKKENKFTNLLEKILDKDLFKLNYAFLTLSQYFKKNFLIKKIDLNYHFNFLNEDAHYGRKQDFYYLIDVPKIEKLRRKQFMYNIYLIVYKIILFKSDLLKQVEKDLNFFNNLFPLGFSIEFFLKSINNIFIFINVLYMVNIHIWFWNYKDRAKCISSLENENDYNYNHSLIKSEDYKMVLTKFFKPTYFVSIKFFQEKFINFIKKNKNFIKEKFINFQESVSDQTLELDMKFLKYYQKNVFDGFSLKILLTEKKKEELFSYNCIQDIINKLSKKIKIKYSKLFYSDFYLFLRIELEKEKQNSIIQWNPIITNDHIININYIIDKDHYKILEFIGNSIPKVFNRITDIKAIVRFGNLFKKFKKYKDNKKKFKIKRKMRIEIKIYYIFKPVIMSLLLFQWKYLFLKKYENNIQFDISKINWTFFILNLLLLKNNVLVIKYYTKYLNVLYFTFLIKKLNNIHKVIKCLD